jgi:hypothetical protein
VVKGTANGDSIKLTSVSMAAEKSM